MTLGFFAVSFYWKLFNEPDFRDTVDSKKVWVSTDSEKDYLFKQFFEARKIRYFYKIKTKTDQKTQSKIFGQKPSPNTGVWYFGEKSQN